MNTLLAISAGFALVGLCYAVRWVFFRAMRFMYGDTPKPDNKDLFQK